MCFDLHLPVVRIIYPWSFSRNDTINVTGDGSATLLQYLTLISRCEERRGSVYSSDTTKEGMKYKLGSYWLSRAQLGPMIYLTLHLAVAVSW
ncbi:unnamed protein product [Brugia pahangi]|uniref:Ovule protein n=1 Tax=Brugia pahangi TaxID=6280 RepID=A0A0N4TPC1_BRUPA|nr:unnamed protein product [Brugia pahangi]